MSWKQELKNSVTDIERLSERLPIDKERRTVLESIVDMYPMRIPDYYLSLIDPEDPNDPIARMCVPSEYELGEGGAFDTSGEGENTKLEGLQHKYSQTAMLLSTSRCAMYCRHCFRRRMVGLSEEETIKQFDPMAEYIARHPEITNVLISGGDALLNSNAVIAHFLRVLGEIDHVRIIRFGTRLPVVLPQRISEDPELLTILGNYTRKKQINIVTQFNHPRELTRESRKAVRRLMANRMVVSNQTVLLKGVNDDPDTLAQLMAGLVACGVVPYYVFQCRPVRGVVDQFQVPLHRGYDIVEQAKSKMNGQEKRFRYIMSHVTGKIEILGNLSGGRMLFKYHQSKYPENHGRIFAQDVAPDQLWLDTIEPQEI
ncbi:MAG TPA: KamA family radical SAM protein [Candidatus Ventrousia excrementavium]|uniref:KamA family radical SAM protein n=1 Tax=Candidatus Ventrousia excrementavium TaxID=2840961 RepID=A0A9D1IUQ9_9CLOT|nr:KamA family radical SAM protein [Candidatus Ventrousia excrementavium]